MKHMTVLAMASLLMGSRKAAEAVFPQYHQACDWEPSAWHEVIGAGDITSLIDGNEKVTCPQCAVMLDMALELAENPHLVPFQ